MFYLLFSLAFAIMALLYVLNGMRKGKKYVWSYSLARLIVVIVSAIASAFLSASISFLIFKLIFGAVAEGSGTMSGLLTALPLMSDALCAIASMIVAPFLFYVIFLVLRIVLTLVTKIVLRSIVTKMAQKKKAGSSEASEPVAEAQEPVTEAEEAVVEETATVCAESSAEPIKKKSKKEKKHKADGVFRIDGQKNPWGRLLGALCGLVLFLATMIPTVGMLGIINDMTSWATAGEKNPVVQTVASFVDAGANNVGAKAVRAVGGDALYSVMTTYKVGEEKATLAKETNLLGVMGHAMSDMTNPEVPRTEAAASFQQIDDAFRETTLIPTVLPDFLSASKESWDRGEEYYGVEKPSFGAMDGLVHPILDVVGTSTQQTLEEDVTTLVELTSYMIEKDVMTNIKEDPMSIFKKQEVTEEVMYQLLENDHLAPLVGGFAKFGLVNFGEALGVSMEEIEPDSSEIYDTNREARALSQTLFLMAETTEQLKASGFTTLDSLRGMGALMDGLAFTETIGKENTDKIMKNILISPRMSSATGFDYDTSVEWAKRINEGANGIGYQVMLGLMCDTVEAMERFPVFGN